MEAIFGSVEHAVHVSFYIQSLEPRRSGGLRVVLIRALEDLGELSGSQQRFLDYLRGEPSATINFGGLTGDEVRAQCAMIVDAVSSHLRPELRYVVWLRHAYGATRKNGVFGFAPYVWPSTGLSSKKACIALLAAHAYPQQRERELSYPEIQRETGVALRTLERAGFKIRKHVRISHDEAMERLAPMFERDGVCKVSETA